MAQFPLRPRKHDKRILQWVGYHGRVTLHQALGHQFMARGISPSFGDRVVRRLVREGFLKVEPLDPERGRASRRVLALTRDGWRRLLIEPPDDFDKPVQGAMLEYRLQRAEMLTIRQREGWVLRLKEQAWSDVRTWLLHRYRGRMLNGTEQVERDRLERIPKPDLPLDVLVHPKKQELRFILPVRRGLSIRTRLLQMPATGLWPTVEFELVCTEMPDFDAAVDEVRRWSRRARLKVQVHCVRHHRSVPLPKSLWGRRQSKRTS